MELLFKSPISENTAILFIFLMAGIYAVVPLLTWEWIPWPLVGVGYLAFVGLGYKYAVDKGIPADRLFIVLIGSVSLAFFLYWLFTLLFGGFWKFDIDMMPSFYAASVIVILREIGKREQKKRVATPPP
jgi:hypothetical protein